MAATVEYHEKPTGTQSDLVKTSLGNVNHVLLRVLVYLTLRVCNLRQPKTRSQDGTSTEICQLHRGKLELQHSLAAQVLERIYAINKNKQ